MVRDSDPGTLELRDVWSGLGLSPEAECPQKIPKSWQGVIPNKIKLTAYASFDCVLIQTVLTFATKFDRYID